LKLNWKENNFTAEFVAIDYGDPLQNKFSYKLEGYDDRWTNPSTNRYVSYTELPGGTYTLMVKACNSEGVWNNQPYSIRIEVIPPFWKTRWFIIVSVFSVLGAFYAYSTWRTERIRKEKKILEEKVQERTRELAQKNRDITSSIEYARRIQQALLPYPDFLKKNFSNTFILYLPKDIVSGDFYWAGIRKEYHIMAAVDCTGHGVPGAFMSLIGNNLLNQIVLERGYVMPHEILEQLNEEIVLALKQKDPDSQTNDGMDVSVLSWNKSGDFFWAGANRPLIVVSSDGKAEKISGNKYPIGGSHFGYERKFTLHTFHPAEDTMFYLFSDGYADQFGGESGKKFMLSKLIALFVEISRSELENQKQILESKLSDWKGDNEQVDDILVIGVKS
jgi:serine phosphatase RsbU (regulator of sigma subunit)